MNDPELCPECGAPKSRHGQDGFCPALLLGLAWSETIGAPEHIPDFGDYQHVERIATGGMGMVCRARQVSLNRRVALKIFRDPCLASPDAIRRFRSEAESAAQLDHPNIVPIFEVGRHADFHYFSMKLIEGTDLWHETEGRPMQDARRVARLLAGIAQAVHHAHQRGVIHRDLKPANILIDRDGQPHVADFGIAAGLGPVDGGDGAGRVLGTPAYMAPEQTGEAAGVTTACDVYGLGAVLYSLLTGRPPFLQRPGETAARFLHRIRSEPVPVPASVVPGVDPDLAAISVKCLAKSPSDRYSSAEAVLREIERWLSGRPIEARRIGPVERAAKWMRRSPAWAALVAVATLFLVFGLAGLGWHLRRTEKLNHGLSRAVLRSELQHVEDGFRKGDSDLSLAQLVHLARSHPGDALVARRLSSAIFHRRYGHPAFPALVGPGGFTSAKFTPDGRWIVAMSGESDARVFDAHSGALHATYPGYGFHYDSLSTAFDGERVVTGLRDGDILLWRPEDGRTLARWTGHRGMIESTDVSPDGRWVLTASRDGTARVWDASSGTPVTPYLRHGDRIRFARFSPDGRWVGTASYDGTARLWDAATGAPVGEPFRHAEGVESLAFSPDGSRLLTTTRERGARLWDLRTGLPMGAPLEHGQRTLFGAFSPDGRVVATASTDGTARLWNGTNGTPTTPPLRHRSQVRILAFSPDGRWLLTGSYDMMTRLWDVRSGSPVVGPLPGSGRVRHVEFSRDGETLISADDGGRAQVWRVPAELDRLDFRHGGKITHAVFSPHGNRLATASRDGIVRVWNPGDGSEACTPLRHAEKLESLVFDHAGERLLVAGLTGVATLWDVATGTALQEFGHRTNRAVYRVFWDALERRVITACEDGEARIWNASGGLERSFHHPAPVVDADLSVDESLLVTASPDGVGRVWEVATGRLRTDQLLHSDVLNTARFDRAGRRIVTASMDKTSRLWEVTRTGIRTLAVLPHRSPVRAAEFDPTSRIILSRCYDNAAYLWRESDDGWVARPIHHDGEVLHAGFGSGGRSVVTAARDGTCRVWDAESGWQQFEAFEHAAAVVHADFSTDGRWIIAASGDTAHLRVLPSPPVPLPGWFLDLAEAMAGARVDDRQGIERVPCDGYFRARHAVDGSRDRGAWMESCRSFLGLTSGHATSSAAHDEKGRNSP